MAEQADAVRAAGCAQIEHAGVVADKKLRLGQQRNDFLQGGLDQRDQGTAASGALRDGVSHGLFGCAAEQETAATVALQQRACQIGKIVGAPLLEGFAAADSERKPGARAGV